MKKAIRKKTAGWLAISFAWMAFGLVSSGSLEAGIDKAESVAATMEATKNGNPENGSFEKEGNTPEVVKKKKFPWLWMAAGAVAAGVIIYFTLIKKQKSDIRGKWRFWIEKEKHYLELSFSGAKTGGVVDLLADPDSYWWDIFGLIGRIGEYAVLSTQVSIAITKEEYPIQDFTLTGYFTSADTMTGTYIYYYSDPRQKSEGTWTASRIK